MRASGQGPQRRRRGWATRDGSAVTFRDPQPRQPAGGARALRGPDPRGPARAHQAGPLLAGARRSQHMVGGAPPRPAETGCSRYRIRDRQREAGPGRGRQHARPGRRRQGWGAGEGVARVAEAGVGWGPGYSRLPGGSQLDRDSGPRPKGLNLFSRVTERFIRRLRRPSLRLIGSLLGFILFPSNLVSWFYYFTCLKV